MYDDLVTMLHVKRSEAFNLAGLDAELMDLAQGAYFGGIVASVSTKRFRAFCS